MRKREKREDKQAETIRGLGYRGVGRIGAAYFAWEYDISLSIDMGAVSE